MSKPVLGLVSWDNFKPTTVFNILKLSVSGYFEDVCAINGSLLPATRNLLIGQIYTSNPDFTGILFVDSDMAGITYECVESLIKSGKDIIGPACTYRAYPFKPNINEEQMDDLLDQFRKEEKRDLVKVDRVGFGCLYVSRKVLDAVAEKSNDGILWIDMDRPVRKTLFDEANKLLEELKNDSYENEDEIFEKVFRKALTLGIHARMGSQLVGEDWNFCERARRQGFECYVDPNYVIQHIGECAYDIGDWFTYLEALERKDTQILQRLQMNALALKTFKC